MARVEILDRLFSVIESRKRIRPEDSYVVELLDAGLPAVLAKIREESEEVVDAAVSGDRDHTARELADLLFHLWVLLAELELTPDAVYGVLEERYGHSGLDEKRARFRKDDS